MSPRSLTPLLCLAVLVPVVWGQEPASPEFSPAALSVLEPVVAELEQLAKYEGTTRSRQELLRKNLSRFFALTTLPSNPEERIRLISTLERMSRSVVEQIYNAAAAKARSDGSPTVRRSDVMSEVMQMMPYEATRFKEVAFFPGTKEPIIIERIDLMAFRDTGFSWQLVAYLAEVKIQAEPASLPMEPEAVQALALGVNSYGLLLLRIGGIHAKQDYAPQLQSRHLRAAGKSVAQRLADLGASTPSANPGASVQSWFTEISESSGLRFRHVSSDWISRFRRYGYNAPSFSGGGVSAGYLDDDHWVDLMVCGGQGCAVFLNRGDGTFRDATAISGVSVDGEARMAVLADFDNDGDADIFVTYARDTNRLFHNLGGGLFEDLTAESGLQQDGDISGPAIAVDFDNDGLLDIYVGNFGNYLEGELPWSPNKSTNGMPNRLYRNTGNMRFQDISAAAGIQNTGWTQAVSHLDFDLDGDQDIYIANDFGPNDLLVNNGDGTFTSGGITTGSEDPFHGMNVAFADLNRDRFADIFVTNIWFWNPTREQVTETNSLLLSRADDQGRVRFERLEDPEFLQHDTGWSWGSVFFDADNDGDDDLYVVNGFTDYFTFTQYRSSPNYPDQLYAVNNGREPNWLFRNDDGLPIHHVPNSGAELPGINSRGVAPADFDGDGDLDLAVSTFHSDLRLFRNDAAPADHHWLSMAVGDPKEGINRDAVGAQVIATHPSGLYVWRMRTGGEGYLSMGTPKLEMGLGKISTVNLEVIWPGGDRQTFTEVQADRRLRIAFDQEEIEEVSPR